jgi:predicted nucleotidyltransferase
MTGPRDIAPFLRKAADWARDRPDVAAVALVGSHARGTAGPDSDIDLLLLVGSLQSYVGDKSWLRAFGQPTRVELEDWGKVISIRAWYDDGREVEYGLAPPDWGSDPGDEGDARVIRDGIRILLDRQGNLRRRLATFRKRGSGH